MYNIIDGIPVWGSADMSAVAQMVEVEKHGPVAGVRLMADHHKGYSQPIGGVVAYRNAVSPSGVGYDIGCGNKAVKTNIKAADIKGKALSLIMDDIQHNISFGVGRKNKRPIDHPIFDDAAWYNNGDLMSLRQLAYEQLGTVGSGNHYVDLFESLEDGALWVGVHFGSRGFGHKTATGFLNLATGRRFYDPGAGESMDQAPTILSLDTELGQQYWAAMELAGRYAYVGRDMVVQQVLDIIGTDSVREVHNHHNFAWKEQHNGEELVVVRKGATPNFPGQSSFVGGSMADISVILKGTDSIENAFSYYSTMHGAGRVMSRTQAAGKKIFKGPDKGKRLGGAVTPEMMHEALARYEVELRGGGCDESPHVYRSLIDVLRAHLITIEIDTVLRPIGVCMAGEGEFDPYKD